MTSFLLAQTQAPAEGLGPLPKPPVAYFDIGPMIVLVVGALALLTYVSLIRTRPARGFYALFTLCTAGASVIASTFLWDDVVNTPVEDGGGARFAFANAVAIDGFSVYFFFVISIAVGLAALVADGYLRRERLDGPEFYVLAMLSGAGGMLMAAANDLIVLFLGLETLTIALFVLAGFHRRKAESGEAAMKYFILSAFSSAFLLYGIALTYGATGSTNLVGIAEWLASNVAVRNGLLLAGVGLLLVGLGFKVAAVPFHAWTPDVYQGSPSPVTAFMAGASKAAAVAALLRVYFSTFGPLRLDWSPLIWALAVLSLVVGAVLAVVQTDVKRMLAYSSIAHAGYMLMGLQAASARGIAGSLFYVMAYMFMVMGSFAVVTVVSKEGDEGHSLDDYRGLARRRPGLALGFTVLLLAQAGAPFTSGFMAKFQVIGAAVDSHSYALALIAVVVTAISAYFYLRVVLTMWGGDPTGEGDESGEVDTSRVRIPFAAGLALAVTIGFTLLAGVLPNFVDFAERATLLF